MTKDRPDFPQGWDRVDDRIDSGQAWLFKSKRQHDSYPDEYFAVKILQHPDRFERFSREIDTMTRLHANGVDNLPPIIESGQTPKKKRPYYIMPWYTKGNLASAVAYMDTEAKLTVLYELANIFASCTSA